MCVGGTQKISRTRAAKIAQGVNDVNTVCRTKDNNFTYAPSGRNVTTHHSATPAEFSHLVSLHIHIRPMRLDIKDRCARLPRRAKHTKHRLLNRAMHTQHRCYEVTHRRQPKR